METKIRIRRMKEIYDRLYKMSNENEITNIAIKVEEDEELNNLLWEEPASITALIDSMNSMRKSELIDVLTDLMTDPMCRYIILRVGEEKEYLM